MTTLPHTAALRLSTLPPAMGTCTPSILPAATS
eukprot:CAMPEP_0194267940 /NCGR_PEP_ID=MMETSP0169-20130528/2353_1 /TAXON_ID=218684 /ORGANISM="Corethron pennatum, Strain L29A3" /LENGTH=32 /DNA_ID= /DNA_START= /DNA_END= /DNA_ORIENTATION=